MLTTAFDIDRPGKDSYRHREAGASEVLLSCNDRWALMHERREEVEVTLDELLAHLSPCDLVLIEGFKQEPIPKLEVHRPENGKPPLFPDRSGYCRRCDRCRYCDDACPSCR
jgi:molybdopterin-guanine dinucleotide biosynthesis protein B